MPRFSTVSSSAVEVPPRRHSSMNAATSSRRSATIASERVLDGHCHERRAVHGVGAGGEDAQRRRRVAGARTGGFEAVGFGVSGSRDAGPEAVDALAAGFGVLDREIDLRALGPADPVALHGLDRLGPVDVVELVEQFLAIVGDAQEPLRNLAALDHGAGAPAAPVDDLLVGEHGLVDGVPVHLRFPAVCDPLLEQAGEQPLLPAVVLGSAGRELAAPVVGEPELSELGLHVLDVLVGPARGRHLVLHRRVLRGKAERVPAHGLKDVAPAHALVPAESRRRWCSCARAPCAASRSGTGTSTGSRTSRGRGLRGPRTRGSRPRKLARRVLPSRGNSVRPSSFDHGHGGGARG